MFCRARSRIRKTPPPAASSGNSACAIPSAKAWGRKSCCRCFAKGIDFPGSRKSGRSPIPGTTPSGTAFPRHSRPSVSPFHPHPTTTPRPNRPQWGNSGTGPRGNTRNNSRRPSTGASRSARPTTATTAEETSPQAGVSRWRETSAMPQTPGQFRKGN